MLCFIDIACLTAMSTLLSTACSAMLGHSNSIPIPTQPRTGDPPAEQPPALPWIPGCENAPQYERRSETRKDRKRQEKRQPGIEYRSQKTEYVIHPRHVPSSPLALTLPALTCKAGQHRTSPGQLAEWNISDGI